MSIDVDVLADEAVVLFKASELLESFAGSGYIPDCNALSPEQAAEAAMFGRDLDHMDCADWDGIRDAVHARVQARLQYSSGVQSLQEEGT